MSGKEASSLREQGINMNSLVIDCFVSFTSLVVIVVGIVVSGVI